MHHQISVFACMVASVICLVVHLRYRRSMANRPGAFTLGIAQSALFAWLGFGMWFESVYPSSSALPLVYGATLAIMLGCGYAMYKQEKLKPPVKRAPPRPRDTRIYNDWARPDPE